MDVEAMLTKAIKPLGGVALRSIVGSSPPFENADFLFRTQGVIAELKCLDVDQIRQASAMDKATKAYLEEVFAGREQLVFSDDVRTLRSDTSPTFARKIRQLYEDPLKVAIKKANKQIKETRKALDLPRALGLLIMANNNNTGLDPKHARELIARLLAKESFSGINSVLYLTAGQAVHAPGWQTAHVAIDMHRAPMPNIDFDFIAQLRDAWISELSNELGIPGAIAKVDTDTLRMLTNRQKP